MQKIRRRRGMRKYKILVGFTNFQIVVRQILVALCIYSKSTKRSTKSISNVSANSRRLKRVIFFPFSALLKVLRCKFRYSANSNWEYCKRELTMYKKWQIRMYEK